LRKVNAGAKLTAWNPLASKSIAFATETNARSGLPQYRSSGLRPAQFAEQHGLKLGTLRNWIQKEGPGSSLGSETSGFQELLLPSVAAAGPWAAEVQLPDGWWYGSV